LTMAGTCFGNYYCFANRKQRWNTCSMCGINVVPTTKFNVTETYTCALCFDIYLATVEPACTGKRGCMPLQMTTSLQGGGTLDRAHQCWSKCEHGSADMESPHDSPLSQQLVSTGGRLTFVPMSTGDGQEAGAATVPTVRTQHAIDGTHATSACGSAPSTSDSASTSGSACSIAGIARASMAHARADFALFIADSGSMATHPGQ
jgi:hypothetical protein